MMEKNIHFVVLGELPSWAALNIQRFHDMNPDWLVRFHDGDFIMPNEYRMALAKVEAVGGQSDIMRLAALDVWGGWYFDWDVYSINPISETKTSKLIEDRLLCWQVPSQPCTVSSICAAQKDSPAFDVVREFMQEISEGPKVRFIENPLCDRMQNHTKLATTGDPSEFTVTNNIYLDKDVYQRLMAGDFSDDLKNCAFLHGWANTCRGPALPIGEQRCH